MRVVSTFDDGARVAALQRLGLLDQPPAPDLDTITRLAAFVSGADVGIINLIDADRQWQASVSAGERSEVPRTHSMCDRTVAEDRTVHVPDARVDPRFAANPFVTGVLDDVRLYCSVPLHDVAGYALGTLCVIDSRARSLSKQQVGALEDLAVQVEQLFELRRQHAELVEVLAEVDHYASHDALTGLANRRLLMDRLDHALARTRRTGLPPVVLFCDLDGFKQVNDVGGHEAGDRVLQEVARRLLASVRPADTVARLGGDEFVVLCEDLPPEHRDAVVRRVTSAVEQPHDVRGSGGRVGVSVGVVTAEPEQSAQDVLRAADSGMYRAKRLALLRQSRSATV